MPSQIKAIIIDAGHGKGSGGATDPGAVGSGTTERKEVKEIVGEVIDDFARQPGLKGIPLFVVGLHEDIELMKKISGVNLICGQRGLDAVNSRCISVHINSGGGTGTEGLFETGNPASQSFAKKINDAVATRTGLKNRGVKGDTTTGHGRLGMVRDVIPTAMLIECGFIDTAKDAALLKDPFEDGKFAQGIVKGICDEVGVEYLEPGEVPAVPSSGFEDVPDGQWFTEYVKKVSKAGIMQGDGKKFRPADTVTRAELAKVVSLLAKL